MNDRMKIAARMMAARYWTNDPIDRDARAREAVADADALLKALAESEAEQAPNWHDDVGDWRGYVRDGGTEAIQHLAIGDTNPEYVLSAFNWTTTPQGGEFWIRLWHGTGPAADKARAQDFARRVLEAMEASDE